MTELQYIPTSTTAVKGSLSLKKFTLRNEITTDKFMLILCIQLVTVQLATFELATLQLVTLQLATLTTRHSDNSPL
jgi:hypothetical protein